MVFEIFTSILVELLAVAILIFVKPIFMASRKVIAKDGFREFMELLAGGIGGTIFLLCCASYVVYAIISCVE